MIRVTEGSNTELGQRWRKLLNSNMYAQFYINMGAQRRGKGESSEGQTGSRGTEEL